jgi:inner membrane protein
MEPITHFLTGACIGRAGLNRKTAYATLVAVLAAEAPDMDTLWGWLGPVEGLKHHRGITHTFVGAPLVAGAVVGAVWLLDTWLQRRRNAVIQTGKAPPAGGKATAVHWGWLYLTALIAALSHILLDWTNNYGVRPFFPFNPRWYAGSLVFIAEPVLWALFAIALVMPWVLGLADGEMGARKVRFRGRGWAIFALAGMVALWGWRWFERDRAETLLSQTEVTREPVKRMTLEPYPITPIHWHAILETADYYQTAEVNAWTGQIVSDPHQDVLYKPAVTAATEAAKQTPLGQAYLDWATWPVVRDLGQVPIVSGAVTGARRATIEPPKLAPGREWTTVEFTDLRFAYSYLGPSHPVGSIPLSAWVYIVDGHEDAGEAMDGREEK